MGQKLRTWLRRNRVDVALVVFGFVLLAPIVAPNSAQPASRMALTASLTEHGTVDIDGYPIGVDRAVYEGKLRSDKSPLQPLLAVPAYVASQAFGAESASHLRVNGNLSLWAVTLWSSLVPFLALLVLMRRAALRFTEPGPALAVTAALGFGSVLLPYSVNLFGHALAAAFAFGAWFLISDGRTTRGPLFASGLLVGCAVATEYQAGIVAVALLAFVFYEAAPKRKWSRCGWFLLGAALPAVLLGAYQWRAFGAPWRLPFGYFAGTINGTTEGGYTIPGLSRFADVLTGSRGLLLLSPVVLVGIVAVIFAVRDDRPNLKRHGLVAGVLVVAYVVLLAGWSGTPTLETPGPRYLIPMVPFLAAPIAAAWAKLRRATIVTAMWGATVQFVAVFSTILIPQNAPVLEQYLDRVGERAFAPTVWSMGLGTAGVVLYALTVAAAGWWFWTACAPEPDQFSDEQSGQRTDVRLDLAEPVA